MRHGLEPPVRNHLQRLSRLESQTIGWAVDFDDLVFAAPDVEAGF